MTISIGTTWNAGHNICDDPVQRHNASSAHIARTMSGFVAYGGARPIQDRPPAPPPGSIWRTLRHRVFFWLTLAALVSNIGTWMQNVGAAWLMTSLSPSPLMVALIQTASSLPDSAIGASRRRLGRHRRPAPAAAVLPRMDADRGGAFGRADHRASDHTLVAAGAQPGARSRFGDERSGLAGDCSRTDSPRRTHRRSIAQQHQFQYVAGGRTGVGRPRGRMGRRGSGFHT